MFDELVVGYYLIGCAFVLRAAINGRMSAIWRQLAGAFSRPVLIGLHIFTALYLITLWPYPLWLSLRGQR